MEGAEWTDSGRLLNREGSPEQNTFAHALVLTMETDSGKQSDALLLSE